MNILICFVVVAAGVTLSSGQTQGQCGQSTPGGRILGGRDVERCSWPYTPLITIRIYSNAELGVDFGNITLCGGAIINERFILTTAVCAAPLYGPSGQAVRQMTRISVGDFDRTIVDFGNDGRPEDAIPLVNVRIHNNYNNVTTSNNIAILELAYPIVYNNCKQPACLEPQKTNNQDHCGVPEVDDCIMASVGVKDINSGTTSNIPQQAPIQLFSRHVSDTIVRQVPTNYLPDGTVLGRTSNPNIQTCLFDWGGIVVCRSREDSRYYLRGLISTNNCLLGNNGEPLNLPPIFITEVAAYRNWIDACVNNMAACQSIPFF